MLRLLRKLIPQDSPIRLAYHALMGWFAALLYGFPARKMICIGVTGTDGKTTTVFLTTQLLRAEGRKVGMASTVGFRIGDTYTPNKTHKTTMGRLGLQRLLRDMVRAGCTHAVLEVSSHGLIQSRLAGIPFRVAVITNLSREHLDYHKTMERYKEAKGKLFRIMGRQKHTTAVIGADFAEAAYYASFLADRRVFFGFDHGSALEKAALYGGKVLTASITKVGDAKQDVTINGVPTSTTLAGDFNILNILAALGAAEGAGGQWESLLAHVPELTGVPGRMEEILASNGVRWFIDYAVTPDALKKLYSTLSGMTKGNVIAVLGACGDRDQGKRPGMGEIASRNCHHVFLTDEEPYTEDPLAIIAMLESGADKTGKGNYTVIPERREALKAAAAMAQPGDIVVLSGMGDQTSRIVGDKQEPWSDRDEILKHVR